MEIAETRVPVGGMANQSPTRGRGARGRGRARRWGGGGEGVGGGGDGSVATCYSPWTVAARCLRGVSSSSTVARERKTRCHIRRFIGPLCCRLIPLRAVLFARLLHLLPLKINPLVPPCAPLAALARARPRALSFSSLSPSISLPRSLSPSPAFLSFSCSFSRSRSRFYVL